MILRYRFKIEGLVQGVFFRKESVREAESLGLTGMVRNEPDGGVYLEAQGEESDLEDFTTWLEDGPPQARVDSLQRDEMDPVNDERGFRIEY